MAFLLVSNVRCLILLQISASGSLLRQSSWKNLEEAGPLITIGGNGAESLEYLKIGAKNEKHGRFKRTSFYQMREL